MQCSGSCNVLQRTLKVSKREITPRSTSKRDSDAYSQLYGMTEKVNTILVDFLDLSIQ